MTTEQRVRIIAGFGQAATGNWKYVSITRDIYPLTTVISFEEEIARIKFDIIGITETRRKGEGCLTFNTSGHTFYYKGGDTCHKGVCFIANKKEGRRLPYIQHKWPHLLLQGRRHLSQGCLLHSKQEGREKVALHSTQVATPFTTRAATLVTRVSAS